MSIDKKELEYFVQTVLDKFSPEDGYPSNIIDHVFHEIEQNVIYMARYDRLVRNTKKGKHAINPWIGKVVRELTHMETTTEKIPAKLSSLIETYTELK